MKPGNPDERKYHPGPRKRAEPAPYPVHPRPYVLAEGTTPPPSPQPAYTVLEYTDGTILVSGLDYSRKYRKW